MIMIMLHYKCISCSIYGVSSKYVDLKELRLSCLYEMNLLHK